jgi:hypothetical protein
VYYDRSLPDPILGLLRPRGAVDWLVPWMRSDVAAGVLADVQFRRSSGERAHGCVQIYFGGTCPLQFQASSGSLCQMKAHAQYTKIDPGLFGQRVHHDLLRGLSARIQAHLSSVIRSIDARHLDQEAKVHGGLMRRYSLHAAPNDQWLAIDREVVIGHDTQAARDDMDRLIRARLRIGEEANHRELDALGILRDGRVALVELKAGAGVSDLQTAAFQAASHVIRFQHLSTVVPEWRVRFWELAQQKVSVALIPPTPLPPISGEAPVPIIAALDSRAEWKSIWREAIRDARARAGSLLDGLKMWRLAENGEVAEEADA